MSESLSLLEKTITPAEVIARLGGVLKEHQDALTSTCPFCGSELWLTANSFLCRNDACPALVGSTLELAAGLVIPGSVDVEEALRRIDVVWGNRLMDLPDLAGIDALRACLPAYRQRRQMLRFIRRLKRPDTLSSVKAASLSFLEAKGVQNTDRDHVFFPLGPADLESLEDLLTQRHIELPTIPKSQSLFLVPFCSQVHEIATLVIMDAQRPWQARIDLQDANLSFAGLWHLSPAIRSVLLVPTPVCAALQNTKLKIQEPEQLAISYLLGRAESEQRELQLPAPVFQYDRALHRVPDHIVRLHTSYPDMRVQVGSPGRRLSFVEFCVERLRRHIEGVAGHLNSHGLLILGLLHPEGQDRARLYDAFLANNWPGAADQLIRDKFVIELCRSEKGTLLSTPAGYSQRRKSAPPDPITNFTLRLQRTVLFGDQAPFLDMEVQIGSYQFPLTIPGKLLDAPRDLAGLLQVEASARNIQETPQVKDQAAFRTVAYYLRGQTSKVPAQRGIPFLGWDARRIAFTMPGLRITMDGRHEQAVPLHPDICALDAYTEHLPLAAPGAFSAQPQELQNFMLIILGSLIHGFRSLVLQPTLIRHTGNAVELMEGLFRAFGQEHPLNKFMNRQPGLQAYPALVHATMRAGGTVNEPYFVFAERGLTVQGQYSAEQIKSASAVLRDAVIRVVETLLALPDPHAWRRPQTVLHTNELMVTAHEFLTEHVGIESRAELTAYEWTEKLLRLIPRQELTKVCSYDFAKQVITLQGAAYQDRIDFHQLELELRSLTMRLHVEPGYQINLDAGSAFGLLEQFYGEVPHLTPTNDVQ